MEGLLCNYCAMCRHRTRQSLLHFVQSVAKWDCTWWMDLSCHIRDREPGGAQRGDPKPQLSGSTYLPSKLGREGSCFQPCTLSREISLPTQEWLRWHLCYHGLSSLPRATRHGYKMWILSECVLKMKALKDWNWIYSMWKALRPPQPPGLSRPYYDDQIIWSWCHS